MDSDDSPSSSPIKDGKLKRNINNIIDFLQSPSSHDTVDSGTETSDTGEILDILKDVVAYAEVKSNEDNRSRMVGRELVRLGARVENRFTKNVTHVVFYNGSVKTREKAEKNGIHVVSVSWLHKCKLEGRRLPEENFPAAKISPRMLGARRKKVRSMQPIPFEEELARSKERAKRKVTKENRWKILVEGEAYSDYSPSYLSKLKLNPHLVPETPFPVGAATVGARSNMTPLAEEDELSSVEESPMPVPLDSPLLHRRLFDSDDSDTEPAPPLWARIKKFTPSRRTDDSDVSSDMNMPKVDTSPNASPTKTCPESPLFVPRASLSLAYESTNEIAVPVKKGRRKSLGRKAVLNSAKKALREQCGVDVDLTPTAGRSTEDMFCAPPAPSRSVEDMFVSEKIPRTPESEVLVEATSSSSTNSVLVGDDGQKKKENRRKSTRRSIAPVVEDDSGSDGRRKRNLLRPGDDNLLNPSPRTTPKNRSIPETPQSAVSAKALLVSSQEAEVPKQTKGRRKSMAVSSPSTQIEKPRTSRRRSAAVAIITEPKRASPTVLKLDDNNNNNNNNFANNEKSKSNVEVDDVVRSDSPEFESLTPTRGGSGKKEKKSSDQKSSSESDPSVSKRGKKSASRKRESEISTMECEESTTTKAKKKTVTIASTVENESSTESKISTNWSPVRTENETEKKRKRAKFSSSDSDPALSKKPDPKKRRSLGSRKFATEEPDKESRPSLDCFSLPSESDRREMAAKSKTKSVEKANNEAKGSVASLQDVELREESRPSVDFFSLPPANSRKRSKTKSGNKETERGGDKSKVDGNEAKSDNKEAKRSKIGANSKINESNAIAREPRRTKSTSDEGTVEKRVSTSRERERTRESISRECNLPGLVLTNLHRDERSTVQSIITRLGQYRLTDKVDASTTHVVCGEKRRTLNVLHAITRGCWLLTKEWVFKSLENEGWVEESSYCLDDDFPSSRKSRNEKLRVGVYRPDLFAECGAILVHHRSSPPAHDLQTLIQICQGQVTSNPRSAAICVGRYKSGLVSVSEQWVLDSISSLQLQSYDRYLLKPDKNNNSSVPSNSSVLAVTGKS